MQKAMEAHITESSFSEEIRTKVMGEENGRQKENEGSKRQNQRGQGREKGKKPSSFLKTQRQGKVKGTQHFQECSISDRKIHHKLIFFS